jgi:hypothetical protein
VEEIVTAGVQFPAGGHAGETSGITIVKGDGMFRQTLEIRRLGPGAAVGGQMPPVKGIEHHHYRFHINSFAVLTFDGTYHNTFDKIFLYKSTPGTGDGGKPCRSGKNGNKRYLLMDGGSTTGIGSNQG